MNALQCWQLFLSTGSPEAYLLYNEAKRTEKEIHVSASAGAGAPGDGLQ